MTIDSTKFNLFSQASGMHAINPVKAGNAQPISEVAGVVASSGNPFGKKDQYGVGLVNSSLSNMSYTLPNGQTTTCNTIGIG